jgi:hypothetical protein
VSEIVKYIAITYKDTKVVNPYWSRANDGIESEYVEDVIVTPIHLYSDKELQNFILENESTRNTIKYYKVEQIHPRIETTHILSF